MGYEKDRQIQQDEQVGTIATALTFAFGACPILI
jgi:hypothetical protein